MKRRLIECLITLALCAVASAQNYTIQTIAGSSAKTLGDNGPALSAGMSPVGVALDAAGNIYIADRLTVTANTNQVRKVDTKGVITTVAKGSAVTAVALDAAGNVYFTDAGHNYICKAVNAACTVVAGNNLSQFAGDNGPATKAGLYSPHGIAFDAAGNLYIADTENARIRKVSNGIITTAAGSGSGTLVCPGGADKGDGGPATSAILCSPVGVAVDGAGNIYVAENQGARVRKITNGTITTVAGGGPCCSFVGDNGPATSATLSSPSAVAVDSAGNLYIADTGNNRIRKVSNGIITTIAGDGVSGFTGDNGPAIVAELAGPSGIAISGANIYIADQLNGRIRELIPIATAPNAPIILPGGIVPAGSTVPTIQSGEWVSIYGTNLAASTMNWKGDFPTSLGGTTVTVNGRLAYLSYVSDTQVNFQAPADTTTGPVPVVITTAAGTFTSVVTLATYAPSFLLLDGTHVAGIIPRSDGSGHYGGGVYDILGPTGTSLGYPTTALKYGDTVELFAVGLGPTNPAVTPGQVFAGAAPITSPMSLTIGGQTVQTLFAGLSEAGVYQINVTLPIGLGTGDVSLAATVGNAQTPSNVVISLQDPVPPQGGVRSLSLSPTTASSLGSVAGVITLFSQAPAPGGEAVALYTASGAVQIPATAAIAAGATSGYFTITPQPVSASQTVTIMASYQGTSAQANLTVVPPAACATVGGAWSVYETGSASATLTAGGQTSSDTNPISGEGTVTIAQTGCSFQYSPVSDGAGTGLTPDQLASLTRNGTVTGDNVTVTGPLALLSAIEASEIAENPGLVINSAVVGTNALNGSGTISGNMMTINETGTFTATGTYSYSGSGGSYSLNITSSSTASFGWASGRRPELKGGAAPTARRIEVRVTQDSRGDAAAALARYFRKALVFADTNSK